MTRPRAWWALASLALALAACARNTAPVESLPRTEWSLRVDNHHWLDVAVHVIHGGQRTRVGIVTATTSNSFILPPHLLGQGGEIRLTADPIGGGETSSITTELLLVTAGQRVEWTLERSLRRSSVSVW